MGTAGNMEIEENLAMAYRRGKKRTLSWGIKKSEKAGYVEALKLLDLGLENRMHSKMETARGQYRTLCAELTLLRKKSAEDFAVKLKAELRELNFP